MTAAIEANAGRSLGSSAIASHHAASAAAAVWSIATRCGRSRRRAAVATERGELREMVRTQSPTDTGRGGYAGGGEPPRAGSGPRVDRRLVKRRPGRARTHHGHGQLEPLDPRRKVALEPLRHALGQ